MSELYAISEGQELRGAEVWPQRFATIADAWEYLDSNYIPYERYEVVAVTDGDPQELYFD